MGKDGNQVSVAIIGVGNCASSFVQGVEFYRNAAEDDAVPGLMHVNLGGYHIRDIEFTAAFDVVEGKVGLDLSEAIWAHPNNTIKFSDVPRLKVPVHRGMTHDGLGKYLSTVVKKAPGPTDDIVKILKDTGTDVVVSYLPVGSEMATKWYVEQILEAGCAFVNCIPVFIASQEYWTKRFEEHGLPIDRRRHQEPGRRHDHPPRADQSVPRAGRANSTARTSSTSAAIWISTTCWSASGSSPRRSPRPGAVTSQLPYELAPGDVHVGPSDYVPWLTDRKWCHIRMEGTTFGDVPLNLELKLEVWDSPEFGGSGDRRGALRQTGIGPRDLRIAHRPFGLFHEDPSHAVHR